MSLIILAVAVLTEISFSIFCIITKSSHIKQKSLLRIFTSLMFSLITYFNVVSFNSRYYAFVSLLFLLALNGLKNLIRNKNEHKQFKTSVTVYRTFGLILLIVATLIPALLFPQNTRVIEVTGNYPILSENFSYVDSSRLENYSDNIENRKLNVQFWYPDIEQKRMPLIVFSHGGLGVKSSNESLFRELASHGYVIVSIDHTYHSFFTKDEKGNTTWMDFGYVQELFSENPLDNMEQSFESYQKWMKIRMDDMNFVIDTIITQAKENSDNSLYSLIDIEKIGVMGHSLGGSSALGIGKSRSDIQAVIALESPYLFDIKGVSNGKFIVDQMEYPIPVLNVYSDSSYGILSQRPQYSTNYRMLMNPDKNEFSIYFSGIGHLALTDFALTSPILTKFLDGNNVGIEKTSKNLKAINEVCLAFFNSFLKEQGEFNIDKSNN